MTSSLKRSSGLILAIILVIFGYTPYTHAAIIYDNSAAVIDHYAVNPAFTVSASTTVARVTGTGVSTNGSFAFQLNFGGSLDCQSATPATVPTSPPGVIVDQNVTGTQCAVGPYNTPTISTTNNSLTGIGADVFGNFVGVIYDSAGSGATRIIAANPLDKATVASSTSGTIGVKINVNTPQWTQALAQNAGNWFVHITLTSPIKPNVLGGAFASGNSKDFNFPINTSDVINFATTTDLSTLGDYTMNIEIVQPSWLSTYLSWFGFSGTVLDATTTRFTVVNQTGFDTLNSSSTSIIDQFLASTSPQLIASCASFTSFDLADCLNLLFIPQPSTFGYVLADVNGILQFAPWGYATRAVNILSGTATSSFPEIVAGIPDPSNPTQKLLWHIDPNEMIAGAATLNNSIVDPSTGDPVMPGIRQIVDTVIALSVVSYIFYDLIAGKRSSVSHKTKLS